MEKYYLKLLCIRTNFAALCSKRHNNLLNNGAPSRLGWDGGRFPGSKKETQKGKNSTIHLSRLPEGPVTAYQNGSQKQVEHIRSYAHTLQTTTKFFTYAQACPKIFKKISTNVTMKNTNKLNMWVDHLVTF
jgi:hypothetical protein